MKIKLENSHANEQMVEMFNEEIENIKTIVVKKSVLNEQIESINVQLMDYKSERQSYYNKRQALRSDISKARKQLNEVKSMLENASAKKKPALEKAKTLLEQNIQTYKRDEENQDKYIRLYDQWIETAEEMRATKMLELNTLDNEFKERANTLATFSRVLQLRSNSDFYSDIIISILASASNNAGEPLTINSFKLDIENQNLSEEVGENE